MENDFCDTKILHFNFNGAPYIRIKTPAVYLGKCEIITNISLSSSMFDVLWHACIDHSLSIFINVETYGSTPCVT
jgi:hypothetical protein